LKKEPETDIHTPVVKTKPQSTIKKINTIMVARINLSDNAAPLLAIEALTCILALKNL
jgi:hypothetical protein